MEGLKQIFIDECGDLLEQLSDGLASIEDGQSDTETINSVFRAVHSIKGSAGAFGLDDLVTFAHRTENVLDAMRSEKLSVEEPDLVATLQRASDQLAELIEAFRDDTIADMTHIDAILSKLDGFLSSIGEGDADEEVAFEPLVLDLGVDLTVPEENRAEVAYKVEFRPHPVLFRNGHDPLYFLSDLAALGEVEVTLQDDGLPKLDALQPLECHLWWTVVLKTSEDLASIEEVFCFVDAICDLSIEKIEENSPGPIPELAPVEDDQTDLTVPAPQKTSRAVPTSDRAVKTTLRVDLGRVDRLVNTVGELIINQSMLAQGVSECALSNSRGINDQLESYRLLARDLQEEVMAIRAQPVKPLFQRMGRIVREASASIGKSARLVLEGEATEVDKTLIERLADPLTHMVRNAVDHGLESPEQRLASGKEETGTVRLSAAHRSGSVFIEVSDDGAGLNRDRILEKAISKGLVPASVELSDTEIDNLLFLPGFSTAESLSNLSGRGVGMDVVKTSVAELGGRISISSTPGEGTSFSIIVPLTLAVMDGMLVTVANQIMVLPIASITETLHARDIEPLKLAASGPYVSVRGELLPIVDVAECLGVARPTESIPNHLLVIVETQFGGHCAFAVQDIVDQRQVVIKNLDGIGKTTSGISAATILGNGEIAMILDPDGLVSISSEKSPRNNSPEKVHNERTAVQ